jgi:transposase InsO family protein
MLLGYAGKVGLSSVKNYLALFGPRKQNNNSGQRWFTFIRNHIDVTSAVDFFTVILGNFKTLYCFVVLSHDRRKILHVNVTEHPDQQWVIQQMREAFPYATLPRYLIHDNDPMFNVSLKEYLKRLGTRPVATSVRSPWQNAYCERVIGTIRRECTDHFIFFSENHVRKVLREYVEYYNNVRPHSSLDAQTPSATRKVQPVNVGKVVAFPVLNGLHHEYRRIAA